MSPSSTYHSVWNFLYVFYERACLKLNNRNVVLAKCLLVMIDYSREKANFRRVELFK